MEKAVVCLPYNLSKPGVDKILLSKNSSWFPSSSQSDFFIGYFKNCTVLNEMLQIRQPVSGTIVMPKNVPRYFINSMGSFCT